MRPLTAFNSAPFHGFGTEEALREFADALPDGLFTTDLAGKVTFWNPAAARITGWSPEEAVGRDCSILAGDAIDGCASGVGPVRCGLLAQGRTSKSCSLRTKGGQLLCIVKHATPIFAQTGLATGALESFTAVGEEGLEPRCSWPASERGHGVFSGVAGRLPAMDELSRTIALVARSSANVMILGESGTGKEAVAEAIHRSSPRADKPFVRVSCSALDDALLGRELFGHVRGGPTGTRQDRPGRLEEAHGGTLLLDEIGDVSPAMQLELLRVIERRELERAGAAAPIELDVRLLCTTHQNLQAMLEDGRFRADLYFRLAIFPLRVPPLRERSEDVPMLVEALLARLAKRGTPRPAGVTREALAALQANPWPGNVRELQGVLELAALRAGPGLLELSHLPEELRRPVAVLRPAMNDPAGVAGAAARRGGRAGKPQAEALLAMLERCGGNRAEAARRLGVSRVTLWKWMKRLGTPGDRDEG